MKLALEHQIKVLQSDWLIVSCQSFRAHNLKNCKIAMNAT